MNRKNSILIVLLVLQVGLLAFLYRPTTDTGPETRKFFTFSADAVHEIHIREVEDGHRVVLRRQQEGWQVKGTDQYPADDTKVKALLDKLLALTSKRVVTTTRSSQVRLKVAEQLYNRLITLKDKDGKEASLYLGSSPNYKTLHVRAEGEDAVYLVNDLSIYEVQTGVESWWDTHYLRLQRDDLAEVTLRNAKGEIRLRRGEGGAWQLADSPATALAQEAVGELLDKICGITILKYEGKTGKDGYLLAEPAATITLLTKKNSSVVLQIGQQRQDENNHILKADSSPYYASVANYVVEPLLEKEAATLKAPEKEAAASEPAAAEAAEK